MNNLYLPEAAAQLVQRPGAVVGKGGNPHQYLVDGEKYQRVTTILDATVPKPALIPWATRTGVEKMAQLVYDDWAKGEWTLGEDKAELFNYLCEQAKAEPDRVKDAAADWGTEAHGHIQTHIELIMGKEAVELYYEAPPAEYLTTVKAFIALSQDLDINWQATEMIVWSNSLRVAGTVDAVGQLPDGSWIIMDWKTGEYKPEWVKKHKSGFFWPEENALQVGGAYAAFFTEVTGHPVSQAWVVRFPRNQPVPCETCGGDGHGTCCRDGHSSMTHYACETCAGQQPPGFEARQVANLESQALHYEMLVDHFRWLKQSPWVEA